MLLIAHEPTVATVSVVVVALLAVYVLAYTARILMRRWRDAARGSGPCSARGWC